MSKAKDKYYKARESLEYLRLSGYAEVSTVYVVDYVTELEKKAKMFDEMVKRIATAVDLFGDCDFRFEDLKDILDRAKKIQRGE